MITQCLQCGGEVETKSRASDVLCPVCKTAKRRKDEWEKEFCAGYYVVDYCPAVEGAYRRGARFSGEEIEWMQKEPGALTPGMILRTRQHVHEVKANGHLRRLDESL